MTILETVSACTTEGAEIKGPNDFGWDAQLVTHGQTKLEPVAGPTVPLPDQVTFVRDGDFARVGFPRTGRDEFSGF